MDHTGNLDHRDWRQHQRERHERAGAKQTILPGRRFTVTTPRPSRRRINVISGGVSIAAGVAAVIAVDRMGHKPMLVIGSNGMFVTLGVLAAMFATAGVNEAGNMKLEGAAGPIALIAANFGITMSFPVLLSGIGLGGAYSFYAICALISVFFVLKFVHETKGKELEHMES